MSRHVLVRCDGPCCCEMQMELTSAKAEGGFYACDIEHELLDSGWVIIDGKELCDVCKPPTDEELQSASNRS